MDEWIPIFVHRSLVGEVNRKNEALIGGGSLPVMGTQVEDVERRPGRSWPPEVLERCYLESSEKLQRWMHRLADTPGGSVSYKELGQAVGYNGIQLRSMLGTAGRRIENRYKLPFPWRQARHSDDKMMYYTMSESDAAVINAIRKDK